jgi:polar amino acid transport system substrate-binding protein
MPTVMGRLAVALALMAFAWTPAAVAQGTGAEDLRVVTRILPPLVVEQPGGKLSGFSIELWNRIGEKLGLKFKYHVASNVPALLQDIRSGKAEVGISAISINAEREAEFDFSQPMLNAGLQIMVRGSGGEGGSNPLWDMLGLLFSPAILVWLGVAVLLILVPAHVVWFLERKEKDGIVPTHQYIPGIFYAMYWAAGTLATQSDQAPRHWLARVVAVLWMFTGVVFVALYTAQLAAMLTVQQIQGGINGPQDLPGKRVATTKGSTAAKAARELRAEVMEVERIDEAYRALLDRHADAVVFDAPVLLFYAAKEGKGRVQMVGAPFRKEDYGIVFPRDHPLRKQVNVTLLGLREDGSYDQLYDKWFAAGK